MKSFGVFYFGNVWWDQIPDANCSGVRREHCSVDAAPGGYVMNTVDRERSERKVMKKKTKTKDDERDAYRRTTI